MNYKELTDEELLKTMEFCIKKEECGKDCSLFNVQGCMWNMFNQSFQLIHRLQKKIKLLEINLANECEEHKQFVKLAKQIDEQQKAEIERLTEENKNLLIKVWNYERPARTPLYSSESMVHCNLVTCYNENFDLKAKNAELQKQVDELTEELDFYKCANRELTSTNEMLKGIAKCKNVEVE